MREVLSGAFLSCINKKKGAINISNELVKQISYILYSEPEEGVKINAAIKNETIWLTQKAMAELFDLCGGFHLTHLL